MPPKHRFTRDEIIAAALETARQEGAAAVTARAVSHRLHSSPKVIFGLFDNMEELQAETLCAADRLYRSCIFSAMKEPGVPPYKACGAAYIRFARDEKELFKWLFMRDRSGEDIPDETETIRPIISLIQKNTGLNEEDAWRLHLELWTCVHGMATMIATSFLEWDGEFVSRTLTDCYQGLKYRFCREETSNGSHSSEQADQTV